MTEEVKKLNGVREVLNSLMLHMKAEKKQFNKFGNYKYRSGEDILEAAKYELKKEQYPNDCTIISNPSLELVGDRLFVKMTTILEVGDSTKESYGYAELEDRLKGMTSAQLTGTTSTYAKKYSLQNLFQLDETGEDIDGKDNTREGQKKESSDRQKLANIGNKDMMEAFDKKNQEDFAGLKATIESCGGLDELKEVWSLEENASIINAFKKRDKRLYDLILESKNAMKQSFLDETKE